MGKRNQRKDLAMFEGDDTASSSISTDPVYPHRTLTAAEQEVVKKDKMLDKAVEALFEKRGAIREKAFAAIIEALNTDLELEFVNKYFATLLHQCLNSMKRGSSQEIVLACHTLGLLALIVGNGDQASEILRDSIDPISHALKSRSHYGRTDPLIQCLAIITFVGGNDLEETESSMQILWQMALPKLGPNVVVIKPTTWEICAVASAWTFLLTTAGGWRNLKNWIEPLTYFSTLLAKDDRAIRLTAGYALAIIFHKIGNLGDDLAESEGSNEGSQDRHHIRGLRAKILNQVKDLSAEAAGKGSDKKDLNIQRKLFTDLVEFFEDGFSPETSTKIGREELTTSTWSDLIQLNYLKHFLGGGFVKHMQNNEFLRDVFDFTTKDKALSRIERINFNKDKRLIKSPNSELSKARTLEMKKERKLSQLMKEGDFDNQYI